MKVGLLHSAASRLGAYWKAYLKELGVEVLTPALPDEEALSVGQESLPGESLTVQLALGRILALGRVDAVLVPRWNAVRGDAWGEALTDLLPRRISGLPVLMPVPDTQPDLENAAADTGLRLSHNAGRVKLALERVRPHATVREDMPALARAGRVSIGVIGPRALLAEPALTGPLRAELERLGLHAVYSPDLPHADVMKRAERLEQPDPTDGERELFGAASLLSGKGAVRGLLFVAGARDAVTFAALQKLAARQHKPALVLSVDAGQAEFPDLDAFRDRVTLGEGGETA